MLRFNKRQAEAPLLLDRQALIEHLEEHLVERIPSAVAALPRGLLWAMLNETIRIAFWMRIFDVEHLRFFTVLRWEMAPGFYREPRLWRIVANVDRPEAERMEALGNPDLEDAWQAAIAGADPDHWQDRPEMLAQ